jgi:NTP pyrophosphatase (non-canonical NTP hydrolase)
MMPGQYLIESAATDIPDYSVVLQRLQDPLAAKVLHAAMGINTEGGEIMDALKKLLFYGKPLDVVNLREEAGDVLWYLALLLRAIDADFETTMQVNIDKLRARYPSKFSEAAALNRDLTKERAILEGVVVPEGTDFVKDDDDCPCEDCKCT